MILDYYHLIKESLFTMDGRLILRHNTCHYILCNVHHLRELQGIYDQTNEEWAKDMMDFLLTAKKTKAQVNGQLSAVQLYCGIYYILTQKKNFTCKKHKLCKVIS